MDEAREQSAGEAGRGHGGGVFRWVWIAGLVLVLYVLGIGPMAKLADKGVINERFVYYVYAPLGVVDSLPFVEDFLDWYLGKVWGLK